MLKELNILNGNLDYPYNEFVYEYTMTVSADTNSLEFEYVLEEETSIVIRDNSLIFDENIIYIDVFNDEIIKTYQITVYKENTELVSGIDSFISSLKANNEEVVDNYKLQLLSVSIFLALLILFSIIFKRKKIIKLK